MDMIFIGKYYKVINGSTIRAEINLDFKIFTKQIRRFYGINAPEITSKNKLERKITIESRNLKEKILNKEIILKIFKGKEKGKYRRWLEVIYYQNEDLDLICLNKKLIEKELAVPYEKNNIIF